MDTLGFEGEKKTVENILYRRVVLSLNYYYFLHGRTRKLTGMVLHFFILLFYPRRKEARPVAAHRRCSWTACLVWTLCNLGTPSRAHNSARAEGTSSCWTLSRSPVRMLWATINRHTFWIIYLKKKTHYKTTVSFGLNCVFAALQTLPIFKT